MYKQTKCFCCTVSFWAFEISCERNGRVLNENVYYSWVRYIHICTVYATDEGEFCYRTFTALLCMERAHWMLFRASGMRCERKICFGSLNVLGNFYLLAPERKTSNWSNTANTNIIVLVKSSVLHFRHMMEKYVYGR